ncbi:prostatic acid phosphatase-like isoform X1 [Rhynchophorus ferrugineus]|uniref:prostatic acid phosphatase-like isoform X1 n=2 Tax=Rhynchophorus ferrugineus TaxID=354439 RepID=UPI003FCE98CF
MFIFIKGKKSNMPGNKIIRRLGSRNILIAMAIATAIVVITLGTVMGFNTVLTETNEDKELKMLHVIMRHGARTPADTYPNDPFINNTFYPVGWGQLTNEGKLQLYEIGHYFRHRYNNFLGEYYWPDEYYAESTDVDRTKASVQLINAGLWPPKTIQTWGPLEWQPIPVHSEPLSQDMLLLVRKPCAAYHIERDSVIASEEIQSKFKESQNLFDDLTTITGKIVKDFDDVQDIFSTLRAEESFNVTLPEWTRNYYPDKMLGPTIFSYILNAWNDKMNRLKGGVLLKKIFGDWESRADGTISPATRKAFLYVGHDSTIVNLMRTLKVWDAQLPDYSITILLELYEDSSGTYGVEVYLRNSTLIQPFKLTIPGCDEFCPLEELKQLTKDVIPDNWDEECNVDESYNVPEPGGP